ncbi:MAG: type II toxin-antitoxin system HicA family toxin [Polyangiaceae bacterium]
MVTARELLRKLHALGCVDVRQKGSHLVVRCGTCSTVVPVHAG